MVVKILFLQEYITVAHAIEDKNAFYNYDTA
jgi:hypothetical protein